MKRGAFIVATAAASATAPGWAILAIPEAARIPTYFNGQILLVGGPFDGLLVEDDGERGPGLFHVRLTLHSVAPRSLELRENRYDWRREYRANRNCFQVAFADYAGYTVQQFAEWPLA